MNANKKDKDSSTGQEASTATGTAAKEEEEAKAKAKAKRMRGVIPLRHLRSDPPPEVMGIAMDSNLPSALESESSAGRVLEVTLLGAPNAGKSSLANALLQSRVSAVSPKAQTTREQVIGILQDKATNTQVVLSDTPGVVPPRLQKSYGREVAVTGWESMQEADVVAVVVDAARKIDDMTLSIVNRLTRDRSHINASEILLILNKMDLVEPRERVLPKVDEYNRDNIFNEIFFVSALKGSGLDELKNYLISKAAPGDLPYPTDWTTDQSLLEQTEEVIREKIFQRTNSDVPYRVWQENLAWYSSKKDGGYIIHQNILVPNVRIKKILVGEGGRTIKCISMGVQQELEKLCKRKVHLYLEVKVQEKR